MTVPPLDDLPIHLHNSVHQVGDAAVGRLPIDIHQTADREAQQYLFDWILSRPSQAVADGLGPTWVTGLDWEVVNESPARVQVRKGIAWPVAAVSGGLYAVPFRLTTDIIVQLLPNTAQLLAVVADPSGGEINGQVLPVTLLQKQNLPIAQSATPTFFYAPPAIQPEAIVPLAFFVVSPSGQVLQRQDMRLPARGSIVMTARARWPSFPDDLRLVESAWEPDATDVEPGAGYKPQWVHLRGTRFPKATPDGLGTWLFALDGFDYVVDVSCLAFGWNAVALTVLVDGEPAEDLQWTTSTKVPWFGQFDSTDQGGAPKITDVRVPNFNRVPRLHSFSAAISIHETGVHWVSVGFRHRGRQAQFAACESMQLRIKRARRIT